MSLLIQLLIVVVVVSCIIWAIDLIPLPDPGKLIARAIVGIAALVWVLRVAGIWTGAFPR